MGVSQSALVSFPKDHRIEKCIKVFASKWVLKLHRWVVDHNQPILGSIVPEEKLEIWSYSKDGAFPWFDFAWLEYRVKFYNKIVMMKEQCWHGD